MKATISIRGGKARLKANLKLSYSEEQGFKLQQKTPKRLSVKSPLGNFLDFVENTGPLEWWAPPWKG